MARKNEKEVPVKKKAEEARPPAKPRPLSPLVTWEHDLDRMFDEFRRMMWPSFLSERWGAPRELRLQMPKLDVFEEKDRVVVKAELPGMAREDVEIELHDNVLTLKGEKKKEEEVKDKDYYRCEREYGSFMRSIELPAGVRAEQATATFKDGVLEVRLPKVDDKRKPTKVQVR